MAYTAWLWESLRTRHTNFSVDGGPLLGLAVKAKSKEQVLHSRSSCFFDSRRSSFAPNLRNAGTKDHTARVSTHASFSPLE